MGIGKGLKVVNAETIKILKMLHERQVIKALFGQQGHCHDYFGV